MVERPELDCVSPDRSSAELMQLRQRLGERAAALRRAAEHYSLLAGETRLKIIHLLSTAGELCVCDLATVLEMTPAAVSQHLTRLRAGRMVASRRDGMTIYYRLTEPAAAALSGDLDAVSGTAER
jgi:DNA-binding transcriptional ArsR family regulator